MSTQPAAILQMVKDARQKGRRVGEALATLGIKRATYYQWKKGVRGRSSSPGGHSLTPAEHTHGSTR
jgi:ACT domain-containing protein